jgi:PBP1b-binding outer membrane lipoprotein LpoB
MKKKARFTRIIFKIKTIKMKKLLPVVALFVLFSACKGKKDEKKPDETTPPANTEQTTTPPPSTETTPPSTSGVPTFSDPDVQKFANEYGAFMAEYKNGMKDPAKMAELAKNLQEWSKKASEIGIKLASKPDEAQKWAAWVMELSKSMMPSTPK